MAVASSLECRYSLERSDGRVGGFYLFFSLTFELPRSMMRTMSVKNIYTPDNGFQWISFPKD